MSVVGGARLVTADDVCTAVQAVLEEHLPAWVDAAGLLDEAGTPSRVTAWTQLPDRDAIANTAQLPAGAITSPGLATAPVLTRRGGVSRWDGVFRVGVAVYDRGTDHAETQARARTWAALVRTTVVQHGRLDGLAASTTWVGEDYGSAASTTGARTFGQGVVAFDVAVDDVLPTTPPAAGAPEPPTAVAPPVTLTTA